MEDYKEGAQKVIRVSRKKLIWAVVTIIVGGLIWAGLGLIKSTMGIGVGGTLQSSSMIPGIASNSIMPRGGGNKLSIEDTREFMKTNYSGTLQTRDVTGVVREVEETVRDLDGRVDNINSSTKSGYLSFVIPKDDLFEFKYRIEQLTHKKLYVESTSSQNLLGQKQNIEEREEYVTQRLDELEASKASLDSAHTQRTSALKNQIASIQSQIDAIYRNMPAADSASDSEISAFQDQANALTQNIAQLRIAQTAENKSYTSKNNSILSEINDYNGNLTDIAEDDSDFMTDIETVNGTVYVHWISVWNIMKTFSPIPIGFEIAILTVIIWYVLKRKKYIPKVELV